MGIDAVQLGAFDQGVHHGGAAAALVGAGEGPIASADGDTASARSAALFDKQTLPSSRNLARWARS
jgi:hypothetical protein